MDTKKPTPEETLFAVIQGKPHAPLRARAPALSVALVRRQLTAFIGPLELPRINRLLAAAAALLGVSCLVTPLLTQPSLDRLMNQANAESVPFVIAAPLEGMKPLADYSQVLREKDPFRVGETPAAGEPSVEPPPRPSQLQDALADLKLVGISWGDDPTVMIEEHSTRQTHFLKTGHTIGPFTVHEILRDRVTLRADGQDLELF